MLIILNGPITTSKPTIGRELVVAFNTFTIDGYKIDLSLRQVNIFDPSGKHVYSSTETNGPILELLHNNDGSRRDAGIELLEKAMELRAKIDEDLKDGHYYNIFADEQYDWGLTLVINAPMDGEGTDYSYKWAYQYTDVLSKYENRTYDTQVIAGSFSRYFVECIRRDLGEENVAVLNVTRNPSSTYVVNERTDEDLAMTPAGPTERGRQRRRLVRSLASTVILKTTPGVQSVKYEDILKNSEFEFNGRSIQCPPETTETNGIVTARERDGILSRACVTDVMVREFNRRYSDYHCDRAQLDKNGELEFISFLESIAHATPEDLARHQIPQDLELVKDRISKVPHNFFEVLGYTPLAYADIVKFD